ncbi:hypothetical protein [Falsiroseomonas sp. CW058]|uniref:hypothetical protein n=1 Tax=Falsiroseomonas sp. CW058 TaxID=3388664 RepID=UPI003D316A3E
MPRIRSAGSISFGGVEYPSIEGLVEVPSEALASLAHHGLLAEDEAGEPQPEARRRGRPPKAQAEDAEG